MKSKAESTLRATDKLTGSHSMGQNYREGKNKQVIMGEAHGRERIQALGGRHLQSAEAKEKSAKKKICVRG